MQLEIIESILSFRDTFVLMPTGGGKSVCFQVPALLFKGMTIVVTPLISLMKDQVHRLRKMGVHADALFSGLYNRDIERIIENCLNGGTKMLYVSPERLQSERFQSVLPNLKISMVVIDEAHCISQWGYDFRPAYLAIQSVFEHISRVPVMALTASATAEVVDDIVEKLRLEQPAIFKQSFLRINLSYVIRESKDKRKDLTNLLNNIPGTGIIYVNTRRQSVDIATFLRDSKVTGAAYHAGLKQRELVQIQEDWMNDRKRVIAATTAFGMGIDKSNVRFVAHVTIPPSLEQFYQEAGRGGRDGLKSYSAMFYDTGDIEWLHQSKETQWPDEVVLRHVYHDLAQFYKVAAGNQNEELYDFDIIQFSKEFDYAAPTVFYALKELAYQGHLLVTEGVFLQSRIKFLYDKVALYDFQLRMPQFDNLIEFLLRNYGGILEMPVKISVWLIADYLKISEPEVTEILMQLDRAGVIEYYGKKDLPQLSFGSWRSMAEDLVFNFELRDFLKVRYSERVDAMIDFVLTPFCRNRILLAYFGETIEHDCGICDNCLKSKKEVNNKEELEECLQYLSNAITTNGLSIRELQQSPFYIKHKDSIERALQYLLNEKKIRFKHFKLYGDI